MTDEPVAAEGCPVCLAPAGLHTEDHPRCPDCGRPADTFACKIKHISINSGAAKAARD